MLRAEVHAGASVPPRRALARRTALVSPSPRAPRLVLPPAPSSHWLARGRSLSASSISPAPSTPPTPSSSSRMNLVGVGLGRG